MKPELMKRKGVRNGSMVAAALLVAAAAAPAAAGNRAIGKAAWFETIEMSVEGPWSAPTLLLVGSEKEWDQAMMTIEAENGLTVLPRPAAPANMDWSEHAVVLVSLGAFSSGPRGLEIVNVARSGSHAVLDVAVQGPGGSGYQTFVAPYHLIKVERRGLKVVEANYVLQVAADEPVAAPAAAKIAGGPDDEESEAPVLSQTWGALKAQF
jgi:hypothetical protein